jgi:hypothetical protein
VFYGPPFNTIKEKFGNPKCRFRVRTGNSYDKHNLDYCYVGAAPPGCDQYKDLSCTGLGFAMDGSLHFQGSFVEVTSDGRFVVKEKRKPGVLSGLLGSKSSKYKSNWRSWKENSRMELTYIQATRTVELRCEGTKVQEYPNVPASWRFAVGIKNGKAMFCQSS